MCVLFFVLFCLTPLLFFLAGSLDSDLVSTVFVNAWNPAAHRESVYRMFSLPLPVGLWKCKLEAEAAAVSRLPAYIPFCLLRVRGTW